MDAFVDAPREDSLSRARQAWIDARVPYVQTEAYRFYDGPIDAVEGLINSWPIDENLIDYVDGEPDAGIINHPQTFPAITSDLIASLNEKGGEKNITTGFHAIEFLLWGQDLNDDGPGQRPYPTTSTDSARTRAAAGEYLRLAARLLVRRLSSSSSRSGRRARPELSRAAFWRCRPEEALACILKGAGHPQRRRDSPANGSRCAYETKEQEDEHSCFSDNTHRDIVNDVLGIRERLPRPLRAASSGERGRRQRLRDCWPASIPRWRSRLDPRSRPALPHRRRAAAVRQRHQGTDERAGPRRGQDASSPRSVRRPTRSRQRRRCARVEAELLSHAHRARHSIAWLAAICL